MELLPGSKKRQKGYWNQLIFMSYEMLHFSAEIQIKPN